MSGDPTSGDRLRVDGGRLWRTLIETASFGATARGGIRRLALTDEDKSVRDWLTDACRAAELEVSIDAIGNMFATRPGTDPAAPTIGFGSHLDTQPAGGRFDGILGVLGGLEVMCTLRDAGYETTRSLTLVNWTNEEGARFAPSYMCSGVWAGEIDPAAMMAGVDRNGRTFETELERIGYRGPEPVGARRFGHFVELHIEQGPVLEAEGATIGVVMGGQGIAWFDGHITGRDGHAGTTPMPMRRDAMAALAEVTLAIESIAAERPDGVGTLGEVDVRPGSRNTIPGAAVFRAEFRHPDAGTLTAMEAALRDRAREISDRRGVGIVVEQTWRKDPVTFEPEVVDAVEAAAVARGFRHRRMMSGAGHDSFYVAATCPTGMIFVPCADGLSHNEHESATEADCAAGAQILLDTVLLLDALVDR